MRARALWLIYKEPVCASDIPELIDMGYEVYTVKKAPWQARTEGLYITNQFDCTLTVEPDVKADLDRLTFFDSISDELWQIINRDFDLVFIDYYRAQFENVVENFSGIIVLRTLGVPSSGSYCRQILEDFGLQIFGKIESLVNRFWFAPVYPWNLMEEAPVIKRRYIELPLSVRGTFTEENVPTENKVYFLCPQIKLDEEAESLYQSTVKMLCPKGKRSRKSIPYTVCGNQYILSDYDSGIEGGVSKDKLLQNLRNAACVYAPQPRVGIVDYYIFCAFSVGAPVIFSSKCGLHKLWDKHRLSDGQVPGMYGTDGEAIQKIKRLVDGDKALRADIITSQYRLLDTVLNADVNRKKFRAAIERIKCMSPFKTHCVEKIPQIGIIFLDRFSPATMCQVEAMIDSIQHSAGRNKDPLKLCVGYPREEEKKEVEEGEREEEKEKQDERRSSGYENHRSILRQIEKKGVPVRKYTLEARKQRWLSDMLAMKGYPDLTAERDFYVLNDGNTYFEDCDALLLVLNANAYTTRDVTGIITTRPIGVFVPDYDTKASFHDPCSRAQASLNISLQRAAKFILVSDDESRAIASGDNGICESAIQSIPSMQPPLPEQASGGICRLLNIDKYFLYFIDRENPDSLEMTEQTLKEYYLKGGKSSAAVIWQGKDNFRMVVVRTGDCWKQREDQDKQNEIVLPLPLLREMIENAEFAFLPGQFDLYKQVICWLMAANICTVCLRLPSIKGTASRAGGTLHYLSGDTPDEFSDCLLKAEHLEKPEVTQPQNLFVNLADDRFYQILKRGFRRF